MFLLFPIGILLIAAIAITILDRFLPHFGRSWLIAAAGSIIAWLSVLMMRLRLPTRLNILAWQTPDLNLNGRLKLLLDYNIWPYALALITVTLAVILSDAARTRYDSTPQSWAASLAITSLGLLAIQAGSGLTLIFAWVVIDVIELIYLLNTENTGGFNYQIILSFGTRITAVLMLFWATSHGWHIAGEFDLSQIPQQSSFYFFLAAGLRLAIFPLNLPFLQRPNLRRGAGNILRLTPVASSLSLLSQLPVTIIPAGLVGWLPIIKLILALTALLGALRWLATADEIEGRPFWIISWASFAVFSVLNGEARASIVWGLALILPGSLLFLYFPRVQRMNFLLFFGLAGLIGLPYTPAASGWVGLIGRQFSFWSTLFMISHVLLVLGYLRQALKPGGQPGALESWARIVYPMGMIVIIQAIFALGLVGWPNVLTMGVWWMSLVTTALITIAVVLIIRLGITPPYIQLPANSSLAKFRDWVQQKLRPLFNLQRFYQTALKLSDLAADGLRSVSNLLEGDGGILWAILFLVLLVSIITGRG
jgi:hypothetical protein